MVFLRRIVLSIGLGTLFLPQVLGNSIYTISDDRVRSLDITPVLGRGYSIMTNAFHSTCLMVDETTSPSYNYDYSFYEFFTGTDRESEMEGSLSGSLGVAGIGAAIEGSKSSSSKISSQSQIIVVNMKLERYYSSLREEVSPLAPDAFILLDRQDYVGFFKACGPNYVRGIRRAQEVVAILKFYSSSVDQAKRFSKAMSAGIGIASGGGSSTGSSSFKSITNSLEISINGYGLGLNQESAETLVSTTIEEFNNVMKYAFKSFTQNENSHQIGMVYGIEVMPWVNNVAFQVASKLHNENVELPQPRSLIQTAIPPSDLTSWDSTRRSEFTCKEFTFLIDKYGYCCEPDSLYDYTEKKYQIKNVTDVSELNSRVCRPIRRLDKTLVKDIMSTNGEFVARLDDALRYRLNAMSSLERCISAVRSQPSRYLYNLLKSQDTVKYDKTLPPDFTLAHLMVTVDPLNDYGLVSAMSRELDEWIEMYYTPCLAALFGANIGTTPSTDPQYFMAYAWHTHSECMKLSCLSPNVRWDRSSGAGCVASIIMGGSSLYDKDDAAKFKHCAKDIESNSGDEQECKHNETVLDTFQDNAYACWQNLDAGSPFYYMEHFCLPQLKKEQLPANDITTLRNNLSLNSVCGGSDRFPALPT